MTVEELIRQLVMLPPEAMRNRVMLMKSIAFTMAELDDCEALHETAFSDGEQVVVIE